MSRIGNLFFAAIGRPRAIEGEKMVVGSNLLSSVVKPSQGGVYFMPTDEIIARKGWKVYREMLADDQVRACLEFKKILIAGRTWELAPGDKSDEAKAQAKFAEDAIRDACIDRIFKEMLSALEFGFSAGEIVWTRNDTQQVVIKKIAVRDPKDLLLQGDLNGNFLGVRQQNTPKGNIDIGAEKCWLFTHDKRFGNLYGSSDLRAAYRPWYAKKFIINFWNVYLERMGSPMTKMTYPQGASEELKNTLKQILRNLASKTEVLVPEGVQIELVEAMRSGNADYTGALAFHNNSIARAILMAALLGIDGDSGRTGAADSESYLQLRILFKMADEVSQALSGSLMEQVIEPMLALNFDKVIKPRFIWQDYGQFEGMKVADTIRLLHAAGILDMDQKDVNYARSVLGLPLRLEDDEPDEVVRPPSPPPPGNANAPPPPAGQGNERAKKGPDKGKTDVTT